jgi:hypothetical protein
MSKPDTPDIPVMQIDDKQYALSDLNPDQQVMIDQIKDLEDQLRVNEFKHQQLIHGRSAYIQALKTSLDKGPAIDPPHDGAQPHGLQENTDGSESK